EMKWINSEEVTAQNVAELLGDVDGILVPGGFGERGIDGKIEAVTYARTNKVPFFGISLGMQLAAVEYARNVMGLENAHSAEFHNETKYRIIESPAESNGNPEDYFRLGVYPCKLQEGTK